MSEPVEIKVTIDASVDHAVDRLCRGTADTGRQVYFLDDLTPGVHPTLPLVESGVVLRLRSNGSDKDDSTVKLRPCRRSQLADGWQQPREGSGFKFRIEQDWAGPRRSLAASCVAKFASGTTLDTIRGRGRLAALFVPDQLDYLAACAAIRVSLDGLTPLGPIDATRWDKTAVPDAVAERWTVGELDFLELSIRCDTVAEAESRRPDFEAALRDFVSAGIGHETKTRRVLEYLSSRAPAG
jgi:hypothetical protein